jgi:2-polyprenyl-3-methyl-5-hydroxy-6-metoxy-1,4-benzoquinol methylase
MGDNGQNEFYTSISKFYSEIFPYNPAQLEFVSRNSGELSGLEILDIGCATGELVFRLAESGATVTGIDLNQDLLSQAIQRNSMSNPVFREGDMMRLKNDFPSGRFDTVLCFGNTLVHLQSSELIEEMLRGVSEVLKSGGKFLTQILNYDYIVGEKVCSLPVIETENLTFIRQYEFKEDSPLIRFKTQLILKPGHQTISNETTLLAIKSQELRELLDDEGFTETRFYSDFKGSPFGGNHLPLVVASRKP